MTQFVDAHWNGRLDRCQFPSFGQQGPQVFLTALARDGQFHLLAPPQGNPVLEDREEFHTQEIALGGFGRAITPEPEQSLGIPGRVLHHLAISTECEDSERGGNPEVLGQFGPPVAPLEPGVAGHNAHRRNSVPFDHDDRSAAGLNVLRPDLGTSGQGDPRFMEGHHRQGKTPARVGHLKVQSGGPEASVGFRIRIGCRAEAVWVVPGGPGFPLAQGRRDGAGFLSGRGELERQKSQEE